jgi:hypothetical protein
MTIINFIAEIAPPLLASTNSAKDLQNILDASWFRNSFTGPALALGQFYTVLAYQTESEHCIFHNMVQYLHHGTLNPPKFSRVAILSRRGVRMKQFWASSSTTFLSPVPTTTVSKSSSAVPPAVECRAS